MHSAQNTAQILDFSTFKRQRTQAEEAAAPQQAAEAAQESAAKPADAPAVWYPYPVWVWLPPFYALMSR